MTPRLPLNNSHIRILVRVALAVLGIYLAYYYMNSSPPPPTPNTEPMVGIEIPTSAPTPDATEKSKLILELFNPSDQSLSDQVTTATLTQQIEQAITVSYVLTKCQMISQDDYANIFRALVSYAEKMKLAPDAATADAVVRHIAESAGTSYAMVYSRTQCQDASLQQLAYQLRVWTDSILQ